MPFMQKSAPPEGLLDPAAHPQGSEKTSRLITVIACLMLVLFAGLAVLQPRTPQYPNLKFEVLGGISLSMLMDGQATAGNCQYTAASLEANILSACTQCRTVSRECVSRLSPEQHKVLSEASLEDYSARMPNGVVVYQARDTRLARLACEESERQLAGSRTPVTCHAPGEDRPVVQPGISTLPGINAFATASLFAGAFLSSWFVCWLIVRFQHLHGRYSNDLIDGGPQRFHAVPTPRVGGLAVLAGMLATGAIILILQPWFRVSAGDFGLFLIAGMPAFLGGLTEDVTKRVGVLDRLLLTMVSGALAAWLIGGILDHLNLPGLDNALVWLPFAILFTAFAVGGIANAINIIDGYNGIAAGYSVIVLASFAWVSADTNDLLIFRISSTLIAALLGFLAWNWPRGRIFLGDGGAYLLGFLLAEISVLLVVRNPDVSPWYPLVLLVYPIFETLFSVYRRIFKRGRSPGRPDALHLHQLIYFRLVRLQSGGVTHQQITRRNNRVAAYIWATAIVLAVSGAIYNGETVALVTIAALFVLVYVWLYHRIVKWRSPRWMMRSH